MSETPKKGAGTESVHAGQSAPNPYAALTTPITCTATYVFSSTAELREFIEGRLEHEEYGRYGNPTVRTAEQKLAALDHAEDCAMFASGMAAITTSLMALLRQGQHVVMTSDCYRRTRQFIVEVLSRWGVEATIVAPGDYEALEAALIPGKTRVLLSESPTNPYLRVADLEKLVAIRKRHKGLKVLIDSTFATPINQRPLDYGVDLVLHSGTKYLGGHNDLLSGGVTGSRTLVSVIRELRGVLGGVMDPHSAYLLLRGLKTLKLRVSRQNETTQRIAEWLEQQALIERVNYPGLASHPDHSVAAAQMSGYGGVVSFLVKSDLEGTSRFIDACQITSISPSLGGVESLISQPCLMSYYEMPKAERDELGIYDNLVRLSVGIEDADDLIADMQQAFVAIG